MVVIEITIIIAYCEFEPRFDIPIRTDISVIGVGSISDCTDIWFGWYSYINPRVTEGRRKRQSGSSRQGTMTQTSTQSLSALWAMEEVEAVVNVEGGNKSSC